MTQLTATVPPMECPDVLLPTPANLANLFGDLITVAKRNALSEIDELREEAEAARGKQMDDQFADFQVKIFKELKQDAMKELEIEFNDAVIGLSDHTVDNLSCLGAVALGASILERHFTDDINRKGPDIKNSMDAIKAKELVDGSKILFQARGGKKGPVKEEHDVINFAFSSIVTIKKIKKGEQLTKDNIWVKRPGTGPLYAKDFKDVLNKFTKKDIDIDQHLNHEDFE